MGRFKFKTIFLLFVICFLSGRSTKKALSEPNKKLNLSFYIFKNSKIVFTLGVDDKILAHRAICNRLIHRTKYLQGEEFVLYFPGIKVSASSFRIDRIEHLGNKLRFYLSQDKLALSAQLDYVLNKDEHFLRKRLKIKRKGTPLFLRRVELIDYLLHKDKGLKSFPGPGQPVYASFMFLGVEYPLSQSRLDGDWVHISYQVGKHLDEKGIATPWAVIGVGMPDDIPSWFFKYLNSRRPRPLKPYLLYNTWYDLRNFNAKQVHRSIELIKSRLCEPYGIKLDAVVLDSTWDDPANLWTLDPKRFPQGLSPLNHWAKDIGAGLGLWLSPRGGYTIRLWRRMLNNLGKGYEKNLFGYCLPAQKYFSFFQNKIIEFTQKGVVYYKVDNIGEYCLSPFHHHRKGRYSNEAYLDAMLNIIETARRQNPEVYFNLTRGTWLSPFWLLWADCIWLGGMDYGFTGFGPAREKLITYRDQMIYERLNKKRYQFPINSIMTHGIIKGRYALSGSEPAEQFEHNVIMYFARGISMWELYISPDILTQKEWQILSRWIKWAKKNWQILKNTQMILGEPKKGEVYGYFHQGDEEAILVLRNPGKNPKKVLVNFDELGFKTIKSVRVEYPSEKTLEPNPKGAMLSLKPFEVCLIKFQI